MLPYERPRTPRSIGKRLAGFSADVFDNLTETLSWYSTTAPVQTPEPIAYRVPTAYNSAYAYTAERESFAGQPGQLLTARQYALGLPEDQKTEALEFLDSLQALTPQEQNLVMAALQTGTITQEEYTNTFQGVDPETGLAQTSDGIGDELTDLGLDVEGGEIAVNPTDPNYASKVAALRAMFPQINIKVGTDTGIADAVLDRVVNTSDTITDYLYGNSAQVRGTVDFLDEEVAGQGLSAVTPSNALRLIAKGGGAASELGAGFAGDVARELGMEGIVKDVAEEWALGEQTLAAELVGFVDPATGEWHGGPLSIGLNPESPTFEADLEVRMGAFSLLGGLGGAALGHLGRRLKFTRSIAGSLDVVEAAQAATRNFQPRTGPLGAAAEVYRAPIRLAQERVDSALLRFARAPEDFFAKGINGRPGRELLNTLDEAKRLYPGDSKDMLNSQAGFVREVYGDRVPDRMVRNLLKAGDHESVKNKFIEMVTTPGGQDLIDGFTTKLGEINRRIDETTDLDEIAALRLEKTELEYRIANTQDDNPLINYPRRNAIRAIVRAPTNKAERRAWAMVSLGGKIDWAKLVDELPHRPALFVPGGDNPADWLDQNTHVLSNYMRRAGVSREVIQKRIGEMGTITDPQDFYNFVEKSIFGEGGDIDKALPKSTPADLRYRITRLHDKDPGSRTLSQVTDHKTIDGSTHKVDRFVLGKRSSFGEDSPLPSRDTEYLTELALPDVDNLVDATSSVRRAVRQLEKAGYKGANASLAWKVPAYLLKTSSTLLKPAVLLVRLPALMTRIQLEQSLRMMQFGFKPWKGVPDGITLFPGGIPVPNSDHRFLAGLFGEDGWRLLDPDTNAAPGAGKTPDEATLGMIFDELGDDGRQRVPVSTTPLRQNPGAIKRKHLEAGRNSLEAAHKSRIDRRIAQLKGNREKVAAWLKSDKWASEFMASRHNDTLRRSTLYGQEADIDGRVITMPASEAARYVEFPNRLEGGVGRTPDQMSALEQNLAQGYDPEFVGASGVAEGYLTLEYNPSTGKAIIREGHHRIGLLRDAGQDVPLQIKVVDETPANVGANIEEVGASPFSEFNQGGPEVGEDFDPTPFFGTEEARLETATLAWIDNRIEYLNQITGGDVDLMDYIASGKLRRRSQPAGGDPVDFEGTPRAMQHEVLLNTIEETSLGIREKYLSGGMKDVEVRAEIEALQRVRQDAQVKLSRLQEAGDYEPKYIRAANSRAFGAELKDRWQTNPDTIPPTLHVKTRPDGTDSGGILDDAPQWAKTANHYMYRGFKPLSYADKKGTRGSLYNQSYNQHYKQMISRGYSSKRAQAIAAAKAGTVTRDLMYDLNARTSVQRALKDIFWFAPATQEVLYTWLVKAPSASYWPIGLASIAGKAAILLKGLEATGIVTEDANGEKVIRIPWLGTMISKISGQKVPEITYGKLSGLNIVTTGGLSWEELRSEGPLAFLPGMSTVPNFVLGQAAKEWGGTFKAISDKLQPFGPEATALPQPVVYLWEAAFGEPPPFEPLAPAYLKAQWDRSQDIGLKYAFTDLVEQGIKPPKPEDYGTYIEAEDRWSLTPEQETEYKAAAEDYYHQLFQLGEEYARGSAIVRLAGSTVSPMSLYTTSKEREAWEKFWDGIVAPEGFGSEGMTEAQRDLVEQYLEDNPNSLAYSVFTSQYGKKTKELPFNESQDDAWFDSYYTGEQRTLTAEEYTTKLMMSESRRFYQAQLRSELDKISPTNDPWELLRGGYGRSEALADYQESWDRYLTLNPEADRLASEQSQYYAEAENYPVRSYEAERLGETLRLLKQISPMLTGEDGIRSDELREVQGQIAALYGGTDEFPDPETKTEKAMAWWYDNVLDPHLDKATELYDQAEDLESRGLDAGHIYDQIRALNNTPPPTYKGKAVPRVEEVFFGNRTPQEQKAAKMTWASRPITWLSDFQRETVGYNISEADSKFLDDAAAFDDWFYEYSKDVSPSSTDYDKLQAWRVTHLQEMAEKAGGNAASLLALNEAPPATRMTQAGFGQGIEAWGSITGQAQYVSTTLSAAGLSPKGFSADAIALKTWLYQGVENARAEDRKLDDALNELEASFPLSGGGWRQNVVLYEAIFFGNFNEQYIPEELALIGA